jgi:hypothetical protein
MMHEVKIFTKYTAEMNEFEINAFLCIDVVVDVTNMILQCHISRTHISATSVSNIIHES